MKSSIVLPFFLLFSFFIFGQCEQASFVNHIEKVDSPHNSCAAIFLNNNMLVDDYSPRGKCRVEMGNKGKLVVSEVSLSETTAWPMQFVGFKVAIRNSKTNTLWMYSDETFFEVNLEDILSKCGKDDKIVILVTDREFSLPHHEIEVFDGC